MKKTLSIILAAAIVFALCAVCLPAFAEQTGYKGTVYYVDSDNGNDTNDGKSEDAALKSVDAVNALKLTAGDAVLFRRGCTFNCSQLAPKGSGSADAPITISVYGDENAARPILLADCVGTTDIGKGTALFLHNQSYVTVEKLDINNMQKSSSSQHVVHFAATDGYTATGNALLGCRLSSNPEVKWSSRYQSELTGIEVNSPDETGMLNGVRIEDNELYSVKGTGMHIYGTHVAVDIDGKPNELSGKGVVVRGNYLQDIGKNGIVINKCYAPLAEYNVINNSHSYALSTYCVALWPFACYNALFQFNEAYNTKSTYDGEGFDADYMSYNTLFQYNYSHDNQGGFFLICTEPEWGGGTAYNVNVTVRYNISVNDATRIFTLTGHITDTKIYNNTIYSNNGTATELIFTYSRNGKTWPINTSFVNNIMYIDYGTCNWNGSTGTKWMNNVIYGGISDTAPKNDNDGGDKDKIESSGNIYADPMLANPGEAGVGLDSCDGYKLLASSPALGKGLKIDNNGGRDYYGNKLSDSINIGAYGGAAVAPFTTAPTIVPTTTMTPTTEPTTVVPTTTEPTTKAIVYGDVNSDDSVNAKDLLLLKQFLANWGVKINHLASDVNADTAVNAKDVLRLKQYLADWDVPLGKA